MIKKFSDYQKINEGSVDYDFENEVVKTDAYKKLCDKVKEVVNEFREELSKEVGYELGDDTDKDRAVDNAILDSFWR
jgi:hypothetical protein